MIDHVSMRHCSQLPDTQLLKIVCRLSPSRTAPLLGSTLHGVCLSVHCCDSPAGMQGRRQHQITVVASPHSPGPSSGTQWHLPKTWKLTSPMPSSCLAKTWFCGRIVILSGAALTMFAPIGDSCYTHTLCIHEHSVQYSLLQLHDTSWLVLLMVSPVSVFFRGADKQSMSVCRRCTRPSMFVGWSYIHAHHSRLHVA